MEFEKKKKPRVPLKDLIFALVFLAIGIGLFIYGMNVISAHPVPESKGDPMYHTMQNYRYLGQATVIAAVLLCLNGLRLLFFAIKGKYGKQIAAVAAKVGHFLSFVLEWIYRFICKILGIDPDRFLKGKDKRSFRRRKNGDSMFDRIRKNLNKTKYKDLQSNLDRIRFLFKKFMQKVIKKGYKLKYAKTPVELREDIREEWMEQKNQEDQALLVNLYVDNRYARPEAIKITEEQVEICRNVK